MDELIYAKELIDSYMIEYDIATVSLIQKENTIRIVGNEDFDYNNFYSLIAELDIDTDIYTVDDNIANNAVTKSIATAGTKVKCVGYDGLEPPSGTIGFNAYNTKTKKFGIVTAGHLLTGVSNERLVYVNDQIVNSVGSAAKVDTGTSYDAAFIPFHSMDKWIETNIFTTPGTFGWIKSYSYLDNMLPKDLEGITLTKSGAKTGMEEGKIISTSTSFSYHDKKSDTDKIVYDTIFCENYNESGDSGGPVGIVSGNGSPYSMSIVGITTGTDGSENYYNSDGEFIYAGRSYVSKITNIIGNLGIEIVT